MGEPAFKDRRYTWEDYQSFPDDKRYEIIDGEVFNMSPAPTTRHQEISMELGYRLRGFLEGKPCKPYAAPTDLKLSDEDVVQSDLMVVCDEGQITDSHVEGAPALVVEILSPSTEVHDRRRKMELYARAGVKEVWLVSPVPPYIEVFLLDGATYRRMGNYQGSDRFASPSFPELELDLEAVLGPLPESGESVYVVKEDVAEYRAKGNA
ncbi:hypothetical protein PDESU_03232 [Pontiella desulfatans]|uniref:Putative restriction endonuclease domain-containing protein n=1 Tax=Pontiella desulfatans TaxID=2750659 RepID=A0A6C2U4B8_PONDE|nr:Uma2 family endonuclease [Pontiella desulfatans]VGO14667.1 hypothetical protein PDESU_03232 [Pontiella desulfatans]